MTRSSKVAAAAIVTVLALIATPRPAAQVTPSGSISAGTEAGAAETAPVLRTGAPRAGDTTLTTLPNGDGGSRGAPQPTGMIDAGGASYFKPTPRVVVSKGTGGVVGDATYYCRPGISRCTVGHPFGMYAAAGPEVRAMLGPDWRGRFVIVTDETGRGVVVQLIDFCACAGNHVIDLYWTAYQGMVNPVRVTVEP